MISAEEARRITAKAFLDSEEINRLFNLFSECIQQKAKLGYNYTTIFIDEKEFPIWFKCSIHFICSRLQNLGYEVQCNYLDTITISWT